ncbi:nucleotide exchange factor GrpE [Bacillus sp. 1NLA3E]|uniref:nucleotide exchange factor GrpE n=1 Tax=Bacillus sp. 1NLA3E TaxID=666686 RepID=UPI000247F059|nr:nucleotide exchange factor GrpE [Bacillus sp. 1NLA3E]AGK54981.1 protein grpE [Bacillus sp. 1NLA3E]
MTQEQNLKNEEVVEEQQTEETVETIFAETDDSEVVVESGTEKELEEAKTKIAELEGQLETSENRYLRLQADFDNFRRRSRQEIEASEKYRAQNLITDILPAIDNFERALSMTVENEQTKSLQQGIEMVYNNLLDALKKEGVEPIEAVGQEFNPHLHQAVMQVEDANFGSNVVVEEFQKGYVLKDRVIRPSMVKVNQ